MIIKENLEKRWNEVKTKAIELGIINNETSEILDEKAFNLLFTEYDDNKGD